MKAHIGHGENKNRVVLSLCDYSGNWPKHYIEGGYTVLQYDLKHGDDCITLDRHQVMADMVKCGVSRDWYRLAGILAAPVCTDFSVSGAQYWPAKDADGTTARSLALVDGCRSLVKVLNPEWHALENPVGRLPALRPDLGKPYWFHPHEFAGYVEQPDGDPAGWSLEQGKGSNRYTKKTALYGRFTEPVKKPLEPIRFSTQGSWLQRLGGKSERTKTLRSMTPLGFSAAWFQANP